MLFTENPDSGIEISHSGCFQLRANCVYIERAFTAFILTNMQ